MVTFSHIPFYIGRNDTNDSLSWAQQNQISNRSKWREQMNEEGKKKKTLDKNRYTEY